MRRRERGRVVEHEEDLAVGEAGGARGGGADGGVVLRGGEVLDEAVELGEFAGGLVRAPIRLLASPVAVPRRWLC